MNSQPTVSITDYFASLEDPLIERTNSKSFSPGQDTLHPGQQPRRAPHRSTVERVGLGLFSRAGV